MEHSLWKKGLVLGQQASLPEQVVPPIPSSSRAKKPGPAPGSLTKVLHASVVFLEGAPILGFSHLL